MALSSRVNRLEARVTPREYIAVVTVLGGPYFPQRTERTTRGEIHVWLHDTVGLPKQLRPTDPSYKLYLADVSAMIAGEEPIGPPSERYGI